MNPQAVAEALQPFGATAASLMALVALLAFVYRQGKAGVFKAQREIGDRIEDKLAEIVAHQVETKLAAVETRAIAEQQLQPNGGSSMHDKLTALVEHADAQDIKIAEQGAELRRVGAELSLHQEWHTEAARKRRGSLP